MAKYNMLKHGASGDEVKKLQELLNQNGFDLDIDGIFGDKTMDAVKKYQEKMGLGVDGIVGDLTWGALFGDSGDQTTNPTEPEEKPWEYDPFNPSDDTKGSDEKRKENEEKKPGDFSYDPYKPGDATEEAQRYFEEHKQKRPGEYQSSWQQQIEEMLKKILNRDDFKYDLNGDALYQQYKDQYTLQGMQAMMDTMGQAQAMTGGYGNSYAQTAGQQTYQGYLQQLNDRVPELYQLALDQYNRKGQEMYEQYGLMMDQENQDYGRWRDQMSDYWDEYARYQDEARYQEEKDYGRWSDQRDYDYGQWRDQMGDWQWEQSRYDDEYWRQYGIDWDQYTHDKDYSYQQYRDDKADDQWDKSFQYQQERDQKGDEQWQAEFDESKRRWEKEITLASSSGGSGGGGGRSSGGGSSGGYYSGGNDSGTDKSSDPDSPEYYSGWSAGDWEAFFARYRQQYGRSEAERLMNEYIAKGLIPKGMVTYAASGARGGQMGH